MSAIKPRSFAKGLFALLSAVALLRGQAPSAKEKHLLYVASPGIRNYVEYGGVGVLVYDIDACKGPTGVTRHALAVEGPIREIVQNHARAPHEERAGREARSKAPPGG